ncbi:uncharacterized protein LOC113774414 [Coffea eugenioides]|uniref:uncharacterized protein LOC113774414 n=1 Tax=Coffea eugenioides TaxID=49369 RepID=UPI000F6145D5|nr:uncharacterized protein LOC113774414 [Coffea eugenioides]
MKFLTSSSSTASSTITSTTASTSFGGNVHNSRSTPAGCIAGVFRRLLCLKSLPTHPSDHFKDTDHDSVSVELDRLQCTSTVSAEERAESSATPCIVARLMGLESLLPQTDFSAAEKSPSSIARSRSMNSVDLMKELVSIQGRHRRVKSFRETAPTFLELEDENFFVLSFENIVGESRKSETGSKQKKQRGRGANDKSQNSTRSRENAYEKNKENQDPMNVLNNEKQERTTDSRKASQRAVSEVMSDGIRPLSISSSQNSFEGKEVENRAKPINRKPENELGRRRRMKKRKDDCLPVKKVESDCSDSENSSPNSVLDIVKFPCDPEVTSSEGLSRLTNSKSRRTLTEELENYRKLNHQYVDKSLTSNASGKSRTRSEGKCVELRKNDRGRQNNSANMWGEICELAEKDTIRSNWIPLSKEIQKFEGYREISGEFEIQIFEELLGELVDQLGGGTCHQNL